MCAANDDNDNLNILGHFLVILFIEYLRGCIWVNDAHHTTNGIPL